MANAGVKCSNAKSADVSKNNINILSLYKHEKRNRHPKQKLFFIANYIPSRVFRGFEQLSSSI